MYIHNTKEIINVDNSTTKYNKGQWKQYIMLSYNKFRTFDKKPKLFARINSLQAKRQKKINVKPLGEKIQS
jgi:hypothetical protein